MIMDEKIVKLQELIDQHDNIVFFGGAGVSTESGIPDFRSQDGLYHQKYDFPPETILSHTFFLNHPEEFYKFYRDKMLCDTAKPNAAHLKLAELEEAGKLKAVITHERRQAVFDVMNAYKVSFDESRVAYGDFSSCVQQQVNQLLDDFPNMEAMICANDVMAKTAYQECTRRGIIVGRDIAITGYDDWELAKTMNPPLTTVLQNAFDMGYMAMIGAAELCKGKNVIPL